jgi:hypothetical protein
MLFEDVALFVISTRLISLVSLVKVALANIADSIFTRDDLLITQRIDWIELRSALRRPKTEEDANEERDEK